VNAIWYPPPVDLALAADEVHLWRSRLDPPLAGRSLSADEWQRAQRMSGPLRARFVTARESLRQVLGRYLQREPDAIAFEYGTRGKPRLRDGSLHFSLSHSGDWGLIAIATREIGVDLEQVRPRPALQLARRFFSDCEAAAIARAPAADRDRIFLRMWTIKEARLKATGVGLVGSLARVAVDLSCPGRCPGEPDWTIREVAIADGVIGAIAARQMFRCRYFSFQ